MTNKLPKIDPAEIGDFLATLSPDTKVYLGADSEKLKIGGQWYADYMLVVVIHMNKNGTFQGCRIFGEITRERVYDQDKKKPTQRLMGEVYKVAELYERLTDVLAGHEVEIHLDLNPKKKYVSNHVVSQALGYIKGTTQIDAKIKPEAFSASYAADQFKEIWARRSKKKVAADVAA